MNRLRHWLPALLWAAIIFYFSAQKRAPQLSGLPGVQLALQKTGHATEYGIMAFLIYRPLRRAHRLPLQRALPFAVILAAAYAASDEWHQYFVPGRSAQLSDVAIDITGAIIAMIGLYFYESRRCQKTDR